MAVGTIDISPRTHVGRACVAKARMGEGEKTMREAARRVPVLPRRLPARPSSPFLQNVAWRPVQRHATNARCCCARRCALARGAYAEWRCAPDSYRKRAQVWSGE